MVPSSWSHNVAGSAIFLEGSGGGSETVAFMLEHETFAVARHISLGNVEVDNRHPLYLQPVVDAEFGDTEVRDLVSQAPLLRFGIPRQMPYRRIELRADGRHAWATWLTDDGLAGRRVWGRSAVSIGLIGESRIELHATFGDHAVDMRAASISDIPLPTDGQLWFSLAQPDVGGVVESTVELAILNADDDPVLITPASAIPGEPFLLKPGPSDTSLKPGKPYTLRLRYTDSYGSAFEIRRPNVVFVREVSVWEWSTTTPEGRAVLLWAVLFVLAGLGLLLRGVSPKIASWSPATIIALGSVAGGSSSVFESLISVPWFLSLMGTSVGIAVLGGLISQRTLRALSSIEPFKLLSPIIMTRPGIRRQWFSAYTRELKARIDEEGEIKLHQREAEREHYVKLPVRVDTGAGEADRVFDAVARIVAHLRAAPDASEGEGPGPRGHVALIEGPGGRGKSALKRAVVRELIVEFEANPASPLPVPCGQPTGDLVADVSAALGRHVFSPEVVAVELELGMLIPIYEDVVSTKLKVSHFNAIVGAGRRLLLVSRPFEGLRAELRLTGALLHAEPQPLTRANLDEFIAAYTVGTPDEDRVKAFAAAFEGDDGTFLPILIRLALHVDDDSELTITNVYRSTFIRLLRGEDEQRPAEVLEQLQAVVVDQCWKQRAAYLDYADAEAGSKQLLARLMDAGILVAKQRRGDVDEPRRVGFFHDSMRSFFIARHLQAGAGDWDGIELSARDRYFRETEIFDMAIAMVRDEDVGPELVSRLQRWFVEGGGSFAVTAVLDAVPTDGGRLERSPSDAELSPMQGLERALRALDVVDDEDGALVGRRQLNRAQIRHLARFFKLLAVQAEQIFAAK